MRDEIPQANDAEIALLGAMMLEPSIIGDIRDIVLPQDFFQPRAGRVYQVILEMYAAAQPIDVVTISDALVGEEDASFLLEAQNLLPSISRAPYYAGMIAASAQRRAALLMATDLANAVRAGEEPLELADRLEEMAQQFRSPAGGTEMDLPTAAEFMARLEELPPGDEWLIEHIIQRQMRTIMIAGEGVGKATLMRQIGLHAAAGMDPFDQSIRIRPVKTLYIDAENQASAIGHQHRLANTRLDLSTLAGENYRIWHCPDGIDLRSREGRRRIERALQRVRPDLVLAGPLYKLFRRGHAEDMEQATIEFCELIDHLRVRYDFAVVLEHHVPKGTASSSRDLIPFGSSVLMRWPEVGLTLNDGGKAKGMPDTLVIDVERYRADRMPTEWPARLTRGAMMTNIAWSPTFDARRGMTVNARMIDGEWAYERA